jgi:hypothetical protein
VARACCDRETPHKPGIEECEWSLTIESSGPRLDLSDRLVLEMAERDHVPEELWAKGDGLSRLLSVTCEECGQPWPCETRQVIRLVP